MLMKCCGDWSGFWFGLLIDMRRWFDVCFGIVICFF